MPRPKDKVITNPPAATITSEMYMYWIHCNHCFEIYMRKRKRIFILACHHILCENCVELQPTSSTSTTPDYKCSICSKIVRGRQLGNMMPPHIKELFHPQPWLDDLPTARILQFQQKQRAHFMKAVSRSRCSLDKMKKNCEFIRQSGKKNFKELESLRSERKYLEKRVRQIINKRREIEREQRDRREAASHRTIEHSVCSTDGSGIGTVTSKLMQARFPPAGRSAHIYNNRSLLNFAYRPRMPNPYAQPKSEVCNFTQKNNSFNL